MATVKRLNLADKQHFHGCTKCGRRYGDACHAPEKDQECSRCTMGAPVPPWDKDMSPLSCCQDASVELVDDGGEGTKELNSYKLAGSQTWFRCLTCCRTHPFNPMGA